MQRKKREKTEREREKLAHRKEGLVMMRTLTFALDNANENIESVLLVLWVVLKVLHTHTHSIQTAKDTIQRNPEKKQKKREKYAGRNRC